MDRVDLPNSADDEIENKHISTPVVEATLGGIPVTISDGGVTAMKSALEEAEKEYESAAEKETDSTTSF